MRMDAYKEQKEEEAKKLEFSAWRNGIYVLNAIGAAFGGNKHKYPDNPLEEKTVVVEDMELTEEEKREWTMKLFGKLQKMADENKKAKAKKQGG